MPTLEALLDSLHVVAIPLVTRFRGITVREAALFEGPQGWTEFAPFAEYDDAEAATWLRAAIEFGWEPQLPVVRDRIPVNATVPAVTAAQVPSILARFPGCTTAKVKVSGPGSSLDDDVARVGAVRAAMGPEGRIRVDANGGWNVDEAEHALRALAPYDLEYAEQPCARVDELVELRGRIADLAVPVAADESVRRAADALAVARAGGADVLVLKAAPLGGVRRALAIAQQAGLPVTVSSALDTSIGLAMGAALAAALPDLPYACGLGTGALLTADVTREPIAPVDGFIPVGRPEADLGLLAELAADEVRTTWWRERVARCFALLG